MPPVHFAAGGVYTTDVTRMQREVGEERFAKFEQQKADAERRAKAGRLTEYEQALEQLDEIICPRCLGTGTVPAMSDNGPDAYEIEVCCDHCDGNATAGAAYKALSEYRTKARAELVQLRYFKHCVEKERAWRPIRTAPRDGTHILARMPESSDTCYVICWADPAKDIRKELGGDAAGWRIAWDGDPVNESETIVWMRLPSINPTEATA
jgi:hypothetical protein